MKKVIDYIKKSLVELKKVKWLTVSETLDLTYNVIIFSLVFIIIYSIFDSILVRVLLLLKP